MTKISLLNVGLISMLGFILASNVLNYVAIGTNQWTEDTNAFLWYGCPNNRPKCFKDNPIGLISAGTALNILSFILAVVSQLAICLPKFRDTIALYFVIISFLSTLLSLLFSSIGWFFIFNPQYQQQDSSSSVLNNTQMLSFKFGYSFWLMTPSFGCSIIAGLIGSTILGCTCVANKIEKEAANQDLKL